MTKMLLMIVTLVSICAVRPAVASDAEWLALVCAKEPVLPRAGDVVDRSTLISSLACSKYLEAVRDLLLQLNEWEVIRCPLEGWSANQLRLVFLKRLQDHPEELHYTAASEVMLALALGTSGTCVIRAK